MNEPACSNTVTKWLAAAGVVMPLLDTTVVLWLGSLNPGYSHVRQFISELGEAGRPQTSVFAVWCTLYGILLASFAVALYRVLEGKSGARLGPAALLLAAATEAISGFFPCDPGCEGDSLLGWVHIVLGNISAPATMLAPFLTWIAIKGNAAWRGYATFTLLSGALLLLLTGWISVGYYGGFDRSTIALGAAQRLLLGVFHLWIVVIAIRIWRLAGQLPET